MDMLIVEGVRRAPIQALLEHQFLEDARNEELDCRIICDTNLSEDGGNLMQFQMAFCLNQIVVKHLESQRKLKEIHKMR